VSVAAGVDHASHPKLIRVIDDAILEAGKNH
jgi:hypothetical protein